MRSAIVLVILAACGGGSSGDAELDRLLDAADVECGTLELGFGQACPDTQAALQCFAGADGLPHVTQVFTTEEGDPIFEHFFVDAGGVVLIRDTRQDDFGPKEITRSACAEVVLSGETVGGCMHLVCQ